MRNKTVIIASAVCLLAGILIPTPLGIYLLGISLGLSTSQMIGDDK